MPMASALHACRIGFVAPLQFASRLRVSERDVTMGNSEIGKLPSELWPKRRTVIRLDVLDSKREVLADFLGEVHGSLGVVGIVDA